jgi:hypothetical protein
MDRMIMEDIEIELHPNDMNREDVLCLDRSRKPLFQPLRGRRDAPRPSRDVNRPRIVPARPDGTLRGFVAGSWKASRVP